MEKELQRLEEQLQALSGLGEQVVQMVGLLTKLNANMTAGFTQVEAKFAEIDARFTAMDDKFAAMDDKFAAMDAKMTAGFAEINGRFDQLQERVDGLSQDVANAEVAAYGAARSVAALKLFK